MSVPQVSSLQNVKELQFEKSAKAALSPEQWFCITLIVLGVLGLAATGVGVVGLAHLSHSIGTIGYSGHFAMVMAGGTTALLGAVALRQLIGKRNEKEGPADSKQKLYAHLTQKGFKPLSAEPQLPRSLEEKEVLLYNTRENALDYTIVLRLDDNCWLQKSLLTEEEALQIADESWMKTNGYTPRLYQDFHSSNSSSSCDSSDEEY